MPDALLRASLHCWKMAMGAHDDCFSFLQRPQPRSSVKQAVMNWDRVQVVSWMRAQRSLLVQCVAEKSRPIGWTVNSVHH